MSAMIAHLRGRLVSKTPGQAVVECGGVGYDVAISVPTFAGLPGPGAEVALHVHTHVREDALALFGFLKLEEKQLFEKLIAVSGVGPKLAMTVLSLDAAEIVAAIRANDTARLTRVPGIGKKTAERLALELRDKLEGFGAPAAAPGTPLEQDVASALVNLGFARPAVEKAVAAAAAGAGTKDFEELFRAALHSVKR